MTNQPRKLYKVQKGKKIFGVCAGFAEYLNVDVTIIRLIWAVALFIYGAGGGIYILCALILPNKEEVINEAASYGTSGKEETIDAEIIEETKEN